MLVSNLIEALKTFDPELPVTLTYTSQDQESTIDFCPDFNVADGTLDLDIGDIDEDFPPHIMRALFNHKLKEDNNA